MRRLHQPTPDAAQLGLPADGAKDGGPGLDVVVGDSDSDSDDGGNGNGDGDDPREAKEVEREREPERACRGAQ